MNGESKPQGWYTFGNHFHWVDMQWLWGDGVLANSITDMLAFIDATGSPGNLNFDGAGLERLAFENPPAMEALRAAIGDGRIEVVGATYGQPYAQFHHGESAVRQLTYGVRTATRVTGKRPRAYWEEEFSFFPQLPQLLVGAGFTGASLFFQWTWHTPELPKETAPAIWWEGIDGSKVLTLPRSDLNLHQWPEDVELLLNSGAVDTYPTPVIQQWLELLPSPDWMCRSELVVPGVKRLLANDAVDLSCGTLSTVLAALSDDAPVRRYGEDEVFHGMSLGKNANYVHRRSAALEHALLTAEALAVGNGTYGRPYAQWAKFPSWELSEAWRELLLYQHHDNDECEGLCGHIGRLGAERGAGLADHVLRRNAAYLAAMTIGQGVAAAVNPVGWERSAVVDGRRVSLPPFGAAPVGEGDDVEPVRAERLDGGITLTRGDFVVAIDATTGRATSVGGVDLGLEGVGGLAWVRDGAPTEFDVRSVDLDGAAVVAVLADRDATVRVRLELAPELDALDVRFEGELGQGPDPRFHSSLVTGFEPTSRVVELRHDTPYAVSAIEGRNRWQRKYPTGNWMTSPQEFETIVDQFASLQFTDAILEVGPSLLWIHDGSQAFMRTANGFSNVMSMRDPWDEDEFNPGLNAGLRLVPHGEVTDAWRWRRAQEFQRPILVVEGDAPEPRSGQLAPTVVQVDTESVALTALFQEGPEHGVGSEPHAASGGATPTYARLVELNGVPCAADVRFGVPVQELLLCNLLGEPDGRVDVIDGVARVDLRAHEVATLAFYLPPAPGDSRTLDDDRQIWSTIHHTEAS